MKVVVPELKRTSQLEPGQLFYHLDAGGALCIAASAADADDGDEKRVVPIHYPSSAQSLGVPIYESHFRSTAVILEGYSAYADLATPVHSSEGLVWADGKSLYLPLNNGRGFRAGFLDLSSGLIHPGVSAPIGFGRWFIAEDEDRDRMLWQSGEATSVEGQDRQQ